MLFERRRDERDPVHHGHAQRRRVYVFRPGGALNSGDNSSVVLVNGACAGNVFWAPVGATTLGANAALSATPTFVGNILDAAGITIGHFANLSGRALAFGGTVSTDANTNHRPDVRAVHRRRASPRARYVDRVASCRAHGVRGRHSPSVGAAGSGSAPLQPDKRRGLAAMQALFACGGPDQCCRARYLSRSASTSSWLRITPSYCFCTIARTSAGRSPLSSALRYDAFATSSPRSHSSRMARSSRVETAALMSTPAAMQGARDAAGRRRRLAEPRHLRLELLRAVGAAIGAAQEETP
jgi:hypothetical protein